MRSGIWSEREDESRRYRSNTLRVSSDIVLEAPANAKIAEISSALNPSEAVIAFCSGVGGAEAAGMIELPDNIPVAMPPLDQAPFPAEPFSVNDVGLVTMRVNVPFAAVFP